MMPNTTKPRSGRAVMARLIGLVRPLAGFMALAIALGLAGHLAATAITVLGAVGILAVSGAVDVPLAPIVAAMFACGICRGALRYGEQASNHFIAFKLLALVRDRVFGALRRLAPAKLEGRDRGDLISLITSDIELLEVFFAHTISPVAIAVIFSVALTAGIGTVHPALGAVAAASYLIVGVAMPLLANRIAGDAGARYRDGAGGLASHVLESLRGMDEIIQYGSGGERVRQMQQMTADLAEDERRIKGASGWTAGFVSAAIIACDATMVAVAGHLAAAGAIDAAGAIVAAVALMGSFGPVIAIANLGSTLQGTLAAGARVLDILDEQPVTPDIAGEPEVAFSGLSVNGVGFSYGGERVLEGIDLTASPGQILGICGRSGSGKSTLLRLIMRFWRTDEGTIELGGRDIEAIDTPNLRDMESLVTQDTVLFHDTIRNNVRIARLGATDEEVEEACRKASIDEFIRTLPEGLDTEVGELGDTLSGGERQRLGLARAFLHDAPLMLLDEPTSNLDGLNEAVVLRSVLRERERRCVLLVSHRASTMRAADTVISVENGRMS